MSPVAMYPTFELELPAGWEDQTVPTFTGPRRGNFLTNVVVSRSLQSERLGVERHAQKQLTLVKDVLMDYSIHEERAVTHEGHRAYHVVHSFSSGENKRVTQLQRYIDEGDEVVVITASAAAEVFDSLRPDFEKIVTSLALHE